MSRGRSVNSGWSLGRGYRTNYWQLWPYVKPQWRPIAIGLVCIGGYVLATLFLIYLAGQLATPFGQGDVATVARLAGTAAIVFLVRGIFQTGQDIFMAKAALQIALDLRQQVYRHLHRLDFDYFEAAPTGDLVYRLTEDIDRIGEVVNKLLHQFIPCAVQLVTIPIYMLSLNWQLTLATLIVAPVMGGLIGWFGERLRGFSRVSQNRVSNLANLLTEVFSGVRLVKAFAAEAYEIQRFSIEAERSRRAKYRAERLKAIQIPIIGFLEALSALFLLLVGGWQIAQGNLSVDGFLSYVTAAALLIDPISLVTQNYNEFKQSEASVDRIFELFAAQPTVIEMLNAPALPAITGKVEYRNVSFAYPKRLTTIAEDGAKDRLHERVTSRQDQGRVPVLHNLSFLALPGEMIALVGATGAGKTTLVHLLPRFYDPQAGQILIDGIDIRTVSLASLRQQIGIVPQETILFSGTIAQNIAFGRASFDLDAVQYAARIANAHQFISQFPDGYQTWVGERGINLSGGQRQRVAIARAVLLNPRILILDEATSALDSESEALVQEALERLMRDRTVFIIAHRLATVRRADRILVLQNGQIVESGTHTELLAAGRYYARLYTQQFQD
ncbi:ABC transporter ATP-binding protein [Trichothermofontia sp.]